MNINNEALQMGTIYLIGSTMVTVVGAWEVEAVYATLKLNVQFHLFENLVSFALFKLYDKSS